MKTENEQLQSFLEDATTLRIVSMAKGSWKWQDAFRVTRYNIRMTRDGRPVWYASAFLTGKMSMPQLRRCGYSDLPVGSLHHRQVDPATIATLEHAANGFDTRPNEILPEDHHA